MIDPAPAKVGPWSVIMHITEIIICVIVGAFIVATIEEGFDYWREQRKSNDT